MKKDPVTGGHQDDTWLARLMKPAVAQGVRPDDPASAASRHLDADTLAAWADGDLHGQELEAAQLHAAECSQCLALMATVQRTAPEPIEPVRARGALFRWLVPLAAAATAVAIWIAIPEQRQIAPVARESSPVAPAPAPSPSPAGPAAAPRSAEEVLQPKMLPQASPSERLEELQARRSRDAEADLKQEGRAAGAMAGAAEPGRAGPAPPPPPVSPAPSAPAPETAAAADTFAAPPAVAQRSLAKAATVEAVGTNAMFRWRIVVGKDVERSTDGGQTWMKTASPPGPLVSIRDVDELRATVTAQDGRALSTTDGGATWRPVQETPAAPF